MDDAHRTLQRTDRIAPLRSAAGGQDEGGGQQQTSGPALFVPYSRPRFEETPAEGASVATHPLVRWVVYECDSGLRWLRSALEACRGGQRFLHPRYRDRKYHRSEEHTSELQSLMRNSYAVFCLKKKKND